MHPSQQIDLYTLPAIYDALHAPGTRAEVTGVLRAATAAKAPVGPRSNWLEPACGSGRLLLEVARRGPRALGFDIEPAMVAYANARAARSAARGGPGRRAHAVVADMRNFAHAFDHLGGLPPIHVAFNIINTIRHLPDDHSLHQHLHAVARTLHPRGVYVVGISLSLYGQEFETEDVWHGTRNNLRVTQVIQFIPPRGPRGGHRQERAISHITANNQHIDSTYPLRTYDLRQWHQALDDSPFRVALVADSAGRPIQPHAPGYQLYVLRLARISP